MQTYIDNLASEVSWPLSSRPHIQANHVDGPMLVFRDGQLHWLTPWERLLLALGRTNATELERKHRPNLMRILSERLVRCQGCDGHECITECHYPGATP